MRVTRLPGREFRSKNYRGAVRSQSFLLKQKANDGQRWRVGVVAGAAVHSLAVKRNFWRRQAGETLRELLLSSEKPRDLLVVLSPKVSSLTKKQFRSEMSAAVRTLSK